MYNKTVEDSHRYLQKRFGNLTKIPGMLGKRDMLFSFNPKSYETIFRAEGRCPLRRGLDTFDYYRKQIRPDVYGGIGGLVTDQGEDWYKMRMLSNPVMLKPKTVMSYVPSVDEISREFIEKIRTLRDANGEMPENFNKEISYWTIELIGCVALDQRLGVLNAQRSPQAERIIQACIHIIIVLLFLLFSIVFRLTWITLSIPIS